ncbi:hypothetical protein I6N90_18020 [Paenibacillus sp. GSMTC-2017]|uniref:hypothetical protein n=1 Tax=Paenibacillus sp. GSMTC-2017 TaxID=2794350 RepID=UPI0018D86128|nr:hypothetical protein [Paenibacillus sp. GSMTC-2017]MBH5319697.1 hypothetical protein [Paenibacillus sp. GSMTC-2017]
MKKIKIPVFLHDILGEEQPWINILTILVIGGCITGVLYAVFPEMIDNLPLWRSILAIIFIFDIAAGCIANFSESTSNFYATRPINRIVFIAIHVHIIAVALLLDADIWYTVGVWAYTIVGAFIVNGLIGRSAQRFIGGLLLSVGICGVSLLPLVHPYMFAPCLLFLLKVLYSFTVDHFARATPTKGLTR